MLRPSVLVTMLIATVPSLPVEAAEPQCQWGVRGFLGAPTGDLKDTTGSAPSLGVDGHVDIRIAAGHTLRASLGMLVFEGTTNRTTGISDGDPWVRSLETRVKGYTLGGEYLISPIPSVPGLRLGAGLHLVRWMVDATSSLTIQAGAGSGTVVVASSPNWTKAGFSALASYRITPRLSAEARLLTSAYGWQGERVHLGQLGLAWTF